MTNEQRVRLWDEINRYVVACGGDPSKHVYGNTPRMAAVAQVEGVIRECLEEREHAAALACETPDPRCDCTGCSLAREESMAYTRGIAGDRCESGNECGRLGCEECQK